MKYDIMISHHLSDEQLRKFLTEKLTELGLTVFDGTTRQVSMRVEAVVNCSAFLLLLSPNSAKETLCNDETSLAYISNKPIFPIATDDYPNIAKHLDFALKLTLAKINWIFFKQQTEYESNFEALKPSLLNELSRKEVYARQTSVRNVVALNTVNSSEHEEGETDFWQRNFGDREKVPFEEIWKCFLKEYRGKLDEQFDEQQVNWLKDLLYKEAFMRCAVVPRKLFLQFKGVSLSGDPSQEEDERPKTFYSRVIDFATGNLAMREVFNMSSTVRMDAIRNLASFKTPAVVRSLLDLLEETDANLRAVACISLSKVGEDNQEVFEALISATQDADRLVREASILSLGKMKCEQAIPRILQAWRNDPIAPVRAAAEIALTQMEVPATQAARIMVNLISREITSLKQQGA